MQTKINGFIIRKIYFMLKDLEKHKNKKGKAVKKFATDG